MDKPSPYLGRGFSDFITRARVVDRTAGCRQPGHDVSRKNPASVYFAINKDPVAPWIADEIVAEGHLLIAASRQMDTAEERIDNFVFREGDITDRGAIGQEPSRSPLLSK